MTCAASIGRRLFPGAIALVALTAWSIGIPVPPAAHAAEGICGSTLESDVTLNADLDCTGFDPIAFGGDGITLDLGGHDLRSALIIEAVDRTTVRNGSLVGVAASADPTVSIVAASRTTLTNLALDHVEQALCLAVSEARGLVVRDNELRCYEKVQAEGATRVNFERNVLPDWETGTYFGDTADSVFSQNTFLGTNGDPNLTIVGDRNRILSNTSRLCCGVGFRVVGDDNTLDGNVVTASFGAFDVSGNDNRLTRNRALASDFGFRVIGMNNHLVGNFAAGSLGDGFFIDDAAATVAGNEAVRNGRFGFIAVLPVKGGGNVAYENGDPRQCLNVRCRTD